MVAEFRGPSPHDLGTAELATARAVDESVEVTLHLLDDWHRPMGPIIQVRMTPAVARSVAGRPTAAGAAKCLFPGGGACLGPSGGSDHWVRAGIRRAGMVSPPAPPGRATATGPRRRLLALSPRGTGAVLPG